MNHLKIAIKYLEEMFLKHEERFKNNNVIENKDFEYLIRSNELIEKLNVIWNIEYLMNMFSNQYKPRNLSKEQKIIFETSQAVLERHRMKLVDTLDGYESLAQYLNEGLTAFFSGEKTSFSIDIFQNKLQILNNQLKEIYRKLVQDDIIYTNKMLEKGWVQYSFSHNVYQPCVLSKEEVYLLVERHNGYVANSVKSSENIFNFSCVFSKYFNKESFLKELNKKIQ